MLMNKFKNLRLAAIGLNLIFKYFAAHYLCHYDYSKQMLNNNNYSEVKIIYLSSEISASFQVYD